MTTKTLFGRERVGNVDIRLLPTAIYAWIVGRRMVASSDSSQLSFFE